MKSWRETREIEYLEQCPCCLGPVEDKHHAYACAGCWSKHHGRVLDGSTIDARRQLSTIGDRLYADVPVWGVWVADANRWCQFHSAGATFTKACAEALAACERAKPLAAGLTVEVRRRIPALEIAGSSQQYATAATTPTGPPDPPLDAISLSDLARALFDADETVAAFVDGKSESDPKRRARNRQTAWERDEGGAKTRALATVERIRAMRANRARRTT